MNNPITTLTLSALMFMAAPLAAQVAATAPKAEAEVRRIDTANARIQLRHGPIPNLDMPPMTMVFRVRDVSILTGLKEGDRILFTAEKIEGHYTVTTVTTAPAAPAASAPAPADRRP